jgi:hypothetical protein
MQILTLSGFNANFNPVWFIMPILTLSGFNANFNLAWLQHQF